MQSTRTHANVIKTITVYTCTCTHTCFTQFPDNDMLIYLFLNPSIVENTIQSPVSHEKCSNYGSYTQEVYPRTNLRK